MKRATFRIRFAGLVGMVTLLALLVTRPVGAFPFLAQITPEPSPRPTATPAPYLVLDPTWAVAGQVTPVVASGALWAANGTVTLYWDNPNLNLGTAAVDGGGAFSTTFLTPADPAMTMIGFHKVIAVQGELQAEAIFELVAPTDTPTPTPSNTPTATFTNTPVTPSPSPTSSRTPSPTVSPSPTSSPIPTPTFRPVTPMVTISPMPPPTQRPATAVPATRVAAATRTNTPVPGTPTATPLPSPTPGPGTPSATPQLTPTPEGEISDTGAGVGTIFLWGFVLGGLLVVFRLLRVRGLAG